MTIEPRTNLTDGTIFQFLYGSHSYDGVWFGDKHPTLKGEFWWRKIVRQKLTELLGNAFDAGTKSMASSVYITEQETIGYTSTEIETDKSKYLKPFSPC